MGNASRVHPTSTRAFGESGHLTNPTPIRQEIESNERNGTYARKRCSAIIIFCSIGAKDHALFEDFGKWLGPW